MNLTLGLSSSILPIERPSLALLGLEPWRAACEFVAHKLARATSAVVGDGHPVIIFPGLGTDGTAVAPLRRHCESLGYAAADWGRGYNTGPQGDVDAWLAALAAHTAEMLASFEQSATLIGWSLGGIYARELAKRLRPQVRQVITIGTPFDAAADHSNVGWIFRLLNGETPAYEPALSAHLRSAPPVPTTAIYSRSDGVVAWQTCRHDEAAHQVEDIEVRGSHIGMGWNSSVLRVVTDRLGQRPGAWQPYVASAAP